MNRIAGCIVLLSGVSYAATYTVKTSGGDYSTIQACATAMAAGDTCTVYAGTYNENVTVPAGTAGAFKTMNVNGSDLVYAYSFTMGSYTKVIGFHIQRPGSPNSRQCIDIADGVTNVYITNNVMQQCGNDGAIIWTGNGTGASYVYIQGNTLLWGCGTPASPDACNGMDLFGDHYLVENNDISHVLLAIDISAAYTVIRNNTFHDMNQSECTSRPGCHMDLTFAQSGPTLPARYQVYERNTGRSGSGSDTKGFLLQANSCAGQCYNAIIRFNDVAHFGGGGITDENSGDISTAGFSYVKSYNNTWVDFNNLAPLYQTTNNFGYNSTHGANINDLFYYPNSLVNFNPYATDASTVATFSVSNNLAYCDGSPCNIHGKTYGGGTFTDDSGNLTADPKFVNYATNDFHLASDSPARGAGTYLTTVAAGDSGSGTSLVLNDASYFQDGYGLVSADWIRVGATTTVQITSINYVTNTITLANAISRSDGDQVFLYKDSSGTVVLSGAAPDIGAYPYQPVSPPTRLRVVVTGVLVK